MSRPALPACLGPLVELPRPARPKSRYFAAAAPTQGVVAGFAVPHQDRSEWCWCAVSLGLLTRYTGVAVPQCVIAERVFGGNICGNPGVNNRADMAQVLTKLDLLAAPALAGAPQDPDIRREIDGQRPIVIQLYWPSRRHVVAISAYAIGGNGTFYIYLCDPARSDGAVIGVTSQPFSYSGTWEYSFLTRAPKP